MEKEYAKKQALDLIEKARKATTYEYQEYSGAKYSTFEHDLETLKQIALITIEAKKREFEFWELVKTELEELK